jgi:epoxyqueuosine reductase
MTASDILRITRECGFDLAGVAPATEVEDFPRYSGWVARGMAGEMRYLTDRRAELRRDVRRLLPSARSVICVGKLYQTSYQPRAGARIARYAAGRDYHHVLREGLQRVTDRLLEIQQFDYKICVDTAPLLERSLARQAGLGWIGRNTCLINEPLGSWFFLGEIVTSLALDSGAPPPDRCGTCTRCIDACPTQALVPDGAGWTLDSQRCISYLTIELRGPIPHESRRGIGDHVFGCDICQEVCPWNARAPVASEPAFTPSAAFARPVEELASITPDEFRRDFAHTPVARARYEGFRRNVDVVRENLSLSRIAPVSADHS